MKKKIDSYLGFAKKSRNLMTGYNTCILAMNKNKIKLLILANDVSENTMKKLVNTAIERKIEYRIYGTCDELSFACGTTGRGVFGITDQNFATVILREIDDNQSI
ncbi:MAG: L7Ae/L30e/S12e/Gadd45 family ribosomal protein [Aminipila sp.]